MRFRQRVFRAIMPAMLFEDASHRRKALLALALALLGVAAACSAVLLASALFASVVPGAFDSASRLAFAVRWLLVPGFALLAGVVAAARRGFYADAIDGTRAPVSHGLEINLRYNQNTLEQVVLAAIAWVGLALRLPPDRLGLIPLLATLFAAGRVTFWIGYLLNPVWRSFGMALTMVPTLAAYLWLAIAALRG